MDSGDRPVEAIALQPVFVASSVVDAVVAAARAASPHECCGILLGRADRVSEAATARNISERPATRFLIDPRDHLDAIKSARARGLEVVGFYHSHPRSSAEPSETDLAEASYPNHLFLIASLGADPPELRLYRFSSGNFLPVPFVTVA